MPRARFERLAAVEREQVLEVAARLFAQHGYAGASINQILAEAGLSKGAAYYYFDDKADLFATTIEYYYQRLQPFITTAIEQITPATYWERFEAAYKQPFLSNLEHPYRFGVLKALGSVPADDPIHERLAPVTAAFFGWMQTLIHKGQAFGLVRTDLPLDLLYALIGAVDQAGDTWLLAHLSTLNAAGVATTLSHIVSALRGMLAPQEEG